MKKEEQFVAAQNRNEPTGTPTPHHLGTLTLPPPAAVDRTLAPRVSVCPRQQLLRSETKDQK